MSDSKNEMVINYVPGEECRVAVVEDGKLEEFHAERADAVSHVGNIYVGKVRNVEPAIQAAFIDFGLEQNGFLHVSDLHPQYFPGEGDDTTELVGKKTPRRERPPIQECLRRGQEIAVQVLKEGVGTKGPTVTSYLSIPGRFLVMMPSMDRVGVSRKVEDEETRRKMRDILDQLELPEGFGFIVRTAGMERTKAELKRDLAYLGRLWKDIEKRWSKGGNKPRLLYSESDLLMRALRDMVTTDLDRIVIDDESAVMRAARFMKIVAPRTTTKLVRYTGKTPIFHAMGIEEQIRTMYSREVPLPSGGRLVIDETEALVAIDVNSGKMRDARDAETNAYRTNLEAAEEICRQLKLRDVGGIVVNDLIDMRSMKHRREIEAKFKDLLKKDRARTTLEQISQFGILEMTRQRMRGSYESVHFGDCPMCRGRGLVQRPDSVATDAMRELAALLEHERVARIEMAVGPRIAGELLSSKRRALNRLERVSGKHVEVRVSESVPVDRVTFYCYDDRGADIDTGRIALPRAKSDELVIFELPSKAEEDWTADADQELKAAAAIEPLEPEAPVQAAPDPFLDALEFDETTEVAPSGAGDRDEEQGGGRRRRRRRGRGRGRDGEGAGAPPGAVPPQAQQPRTQERGGRDQQHRHPQPLRDGAIAGVPARGPEAPRGDHPLEQRGEEDRDGSGRRRRRRRRGRGRGRGGPGDVMGQGQGQDNGHGQHADDAPARQNGTPIFDEEGTPPGVEERAPVSRYEPSSWDVDVPGAPIATHDAAAEIDVAAEEQEPLADAELVSEPAPEIVIPEIDESEGAASIPDEGDQPGPRRRRRRGRGRGRAGDAGADAAAPGSDEADAPAARTARAPAKPAIEVAAPSARSEEDEAPAVPEGDGEPAEPAGEGTEEEQNARRRRRRRGRGRGRGDAAAPPAAAPIAPASGEKPPTPPKGTGGGRGPGSRGGRGGGSGGGRAEGGRGNSAGKGSGGEPKGEPRAPRDRGGSKSVEPKPRAERTPPPTGGTKTSGAGGGAGTGAGPGKPPAASAPGKGPVRVLYSSRRKLMPSERAKLKPE